MDVQLLIGQNINIDFSDETRWTAEQYSYIPPIQATYAYSAETNTFYNREVNSSFLSVDDLLDIDRLYTITFQIVDYISGTTEMVISSTICSAVSGNGTYTFNVRSGHVGKKIGLYFTNFIGGIRDLTIESKELQELELSENIDIMLNYTLSDIRDIASKSTNYSKTIQLKDTKVNRQLLGNLFNVNMFSSYNKNSKVYCEVRNKTIPLFKGYLQYKNITINNSVKEHEIVLYGETKGLFDTLGEKMLGNSDTVKGLDFSALDCKLETDNITDSVLYGITGVTTPFYLADYVGDLTDAKINTTGTNPAAIMRMDRFFPSLKVSTIFDKIFAEAGYTFQSTTLTNSSLYQNMVYMYSSGKQFWSNETDVFPNGIPVLKAFDYIGDSYPYTSAYKPVHFDKDYDDSSESGWDKFHRFNTGSVNNNPIYTYQIEKDGEYSAAFINFKVKFANASVDFVWFRIYRLTAADYTINSSNLITSIDNVTEELGRYRLSVDGSYSNYMGVNSGNIAYISPGNPGIPAKFKAFAGDIIVCVHEWDNNDTLVYYSDPSSGDCPNFYIYDYTNYQEYSDIHFNNFLPETISCKEFISSITKMFNLYWQQITPTHYKIETRDTFYGAGSDIDWSEKIVIDNNHPLNISLIDDENISNNYSFSFQEGSDFNNTDFFTKNNRVFGSYHITLDTKNTTVQEIEPMFQLAITADSNNCTDHPIAKLDNGEGVANYDLKPTLGLFSVVSGSTRFYEVFDSTYGRLMDYYPYAGNILKPKLMDANNYDLSFNSESQYFGSTGQTLSENNLYNLYWRNYINSVISPNSKIVTAYFDLTPIDIYNLNFANRIYVANNQIGSSFYYLNRIIDYNPIEKVPTKVELIFLDLATSKRKQLGVVVKPPIGISVPIGSGIRGATDKTNQLIDAYLPIEGGVLNGKLTFNSGITGSDISVQGHKLYFDTTELTYLDYNTSQLALQTWVAGNRTMVHEANYSYMYGSGPRIKNTAPSYTGATLTPGTNLSSGIGGLGENVSIISNQVEGIRVTSSCTYIMNGCLLDASGNSYSKISYLSGLTDVLIGAPTNGDVLTYDVDKWINSPPVNVPLDIVYLTYDGTSGTTSGTHGVTLVSPGVWSATTYNTSYFIDDTYGDITLYIPDADSSNLGKTMIVSKPRIVQSGNIISIKTLSGQAVAETTTFYLRSPNDRAELVSVPFVSGGASGYKYRVNMITRSIHESVEVSVGGTQLFTTIKSAVDFCNAYSDGPRRIKVNPGTYNIDQTIEINGAYPIAIEGFGTSITILSATTALSGNPMFEIETSCDFKGMSFYGLEGLNSYDDQCCLDCGVPDLYGEVHQCYFNGFYKAVESNGSAFWVFDSIIENCVNGIWMSGGTIQMSEMTISNCNHAVDIELTSADDSISIQNILFDVTSGHTGITYKDNSFKPAYFYATGNALYDGGTYIEGLTFNTMSQADIRFENNVGLRNYSPLAYLQISNGLTATTLTSQNVYYRMSGSTSTGNLNTKFLLTTNYPSATYIPTVSRLVSIVVTGSIFSDGTNQTHKIAIYKNGTTNICETILRTSTASQSESFALNTMIEANYNDVFELWCANTTANGRTATLTNLQYTIKV